jgi:hypothetical protein
LINVPVVVIGLVAVAVLLPESRDPRRPRIDVPGLVRTVPELRARMVDGYVSGVVMPTDALAERSGPPRRHRRAHEQFDAHLAQFGADLDLSAPPAAPRWSASINCE